MNVNKMVKPILICRVGRYATLDFIKEIDEQLSTKAKGYISFVIYEDTDEPIRFEVLNGYEDDIEDLKEWLKNHKKQL